MFGFASSRRFPPPWSVEETDPKLDRPCFIIRDAIGPGFAYTKSQRHW
jgi:hypothetical protein